MNLLYGSARKTDLLCLWRLLQSLLLLLLLLCGRPSTGFVHVLCPPRKTRPSITIPTTSISRDIPHAPIHPFTATALSMISSGLTFDDGEQILVSVQKPLGLVLEQDDDTDCAATTTIRIVGLDPTGNGATAGLRTGDVLVAVQNDGDVIHRDLEYALECIARAPRVLNLRFVRMSSVDHDTRQQ